MNSTAAQFGCNADDVQIAPGLLAVSAGNQRRAVAELSADGFEAEGEFINNKRTYSYAAHVAVDPRTGRISVLDYVAVEDVGRIINPQTLHSQVRGAITQGLGGTLLEQITYDEHGQLLTGSLAGYLLPGAEDFPKIRVITLENYPSPINPLGAKGAGEGGIIPVGGVIANAVAAALAPPGAPVGTPLGASPCTLPLTAARVWQLLQSTSR